MSTITREWLQQAINDYESVRDELPFGLDDYQGNILAAMRIALASLEAEPVAWKTTFTQIGHECNTYTVTYFDKAEAERWVHIHNITGEFRAEVVPFYTAPPVSIVQLPFEQWLEQQREKIEVDCGCVSTETLMHWMRVAYEAGNSPVTQDSWINCSELMPNDTQWCVVNTEYGYYVQCWSEGQGWLGDDISIPECDVINWMPLPEPPQEVNRG
ncbi:TPA: DUF551 domain-containing protein [Escherichia coli]|uniref:DUF551 domain-containing protein n=1 Tax=Escherichia coli TaxID=562 RepID=UPI001FCEA213|nr:DUF551 domain-containing protein [Escherichia coli]